MNRFTDFMMALMFGVGVVCLITILICMTIKMVQMTFE
jgi:hypothetical protein